jgi:uncharacterized paraquat-inducible protein A
MQIEPQVSKTALLTWLVNNYNVEQNEKVPALVLYNTILTYPSMTCFGFWQPGADGRTITCSNCGCLVTKEGAAAISSEINYCPRCGAHMVNAKTFTGSDPGYDIEDEY